MQTNERESRSAPREGVGYYCHLGFDGKHVGAILVTNRIGVPLEFKYTEPVTITRMQKILYGAVLDRYLQETLLRGSLAQELSRTPEYFITDFEYKEHLGTFAGREMIALQELRAPVASQPQVSGRVSSRESLLDIDDGRSLRVAFSSGDERVRQEILAWLNAVCRTMDVLEPLDRVKAAIKTILADGRKR